MRGLGPERRGQRIAVGVGVVGQHVDRHGRVFLRVGLVVGRHGGVVDRGDRDGHAGGVAAALAVGDAVGEAVDAVEVGLRRVGEGPVRVGDQGPVGRPSGDRGLEAVAVGVAVVGEHFDDHGHVLVGRRRIVRGHGRIVCRRRAPGGGDQDVRADLERRGPGAVQGDEGLEAGASPGAVGVDLELQGPAAPVVDLHEIAVGDRVAAGVSEAGEQLADVDHVLAPLEVPDLVAPVL